MITSLYSFSGSEDLCGQNNHDQLFPTARAPALAPGEAALHLNIQGFLGEILAYSAAILTTQMYESGMELDFYILC